MSNKKHVALCFATNKENSAFKYILSKESLSNIKCLTKDYDVSFNITGQGPFNEDSAKRAEEILLNFGIQLNFQYTEQLKRVRHLSLLQKCADLTPKADYFVILDDNNFFSHGTRLYPENTGERYAQAFRYLDANPDAGMVNCCGSLGGSKAKYDIVLYRAGKIISQIKGDIIKNFADGKICAPECVNHEGGMTEMMYSLWCNVNGKYVAKQFNNPTRHYELKNVFDRKTGKPLEIEYHEDYGMHLAHLAEENAFKWIRNNIKPDYKFGNKIINLGW